MATNAVSTACSADDALAKLITGNNRFIRGELQPSGFGRESLSELARGQMPFATILGCSDSRVPPELIFDTGMGELFVIRVAGNVLSAEIAASMQYAGAILQTPLFVVMGHEGCGAVQAAMDSRYRGSKQLSRIQTLVDQISPGLPVLDESLSPYEQLRFAVECNVRWTLRQITSTPEAQIRIKEGQVKIVGAVYEMETGRVRFLNNPI